MIHTKEEKVLYICQEENCHAKLQVREVAPDSDGNSIGIYGCLTHQHPLPRNKWYV